MPAARVCKWCRKVFIVGKSNTKFCSEACREAKRDVDEETDSGYCPSQEEIAAFYQAKADERYAATYLPTRKPRGKKHGSRTC